MNNFEIIFLIANQYNITFIENTFFCKVKIKINKKYQFISLSKNLFKNNFTFKAFNIDEVFLNENNFTTGNSSIEI